MIDRETRILFRKEWRQLLASRSAVATAAILPVLLLGVIPMVMLTAANAPQHGPARPLPEGMQFGLIGEIGDDPRHLPGAMLPLLVAVVGMVLPTMMATHLLITERERRTLELLVALPVRIGQVLTAKLLATLLAASALSVPLLVVDIVVLGTRNAADPGALFAMPLLLVAALALSTSTALLISLLSPDFRTANNVAGAMLAPIILVTLMGSVLLPGGAVRPLVIACVYVLVAVLVTRHALRTVTFEKLMA